MLSVDQIEHALNVWNFPIVSGSLLPGPWHWGKIGGFSIDVDAKTMVMTWLTMVLVVLFGVGATRRMSLKKPGYLQTALEMMYDGIRNTALQNMDPAAAASLLSLVVSYFIFFLFADLLGLIPTLSSPTADYQTCFALAIITFILIHFYGARKKGLRYLRHFIEPFPFFLPLTIVEEIAKPLTLAFRLYGNIFAGEMLIMVLLGLLHGVAHFAGGFIGSVVWLAFSIFIGFIQAFIFTALTIAYIAIAMAEQH